MILLISLLITLINLNIETEERVINNNDIFFRGFVKMKWIKKNKIFIVEKTENNSERIIFYNIKQKRFQTFLNSMYSKRILCSFGRDCKTIGIYKNDKDTLEIYKKNKLVYKKFHFTPFAMNDHSYKSSWSVISKEILILTNNRIIMHLFLDNGSHIETLYLIDIDYTQDKILNRIKHGEETFDYLRMPRVHENKSTVIGWSEHFKNNSIIRYLFYYDFDSKSLKKIFLGNKSLAIDDIAIFGNKVYFTAFIPSPDERKYALYCMEPPYNKIKKVMDNVVEVRVSKKYLLLLKGPPFKVVEKVDHFKYFLYRLKDLKKIKNLSKGFKEYYTNYIILISPFEDKIAIFNCKEKSVKIENIYQE